MTTALQEFRISPRVRFGLVIIVAIGALYGLLEWRDSLAAQRQAYRRDALQLLRVEGQKEQQQWLTRAVQAQEALDRAKGSLWTNSSVGRAQAQVQDWLSALMRQTAAQGSAVKVAEGDVALDSSGIASRLPASLQNLHPLRARVEFATDQRVLLSVLAAINDSNQRIVVDALSVKSSRTELALTFWFSLPEDLSAESGSPGGRHP